MTNENTLYTVLIAEDEELLLNNLIDKVNQSGLGFQVIGKAQTGTQALHLVESLSPNLLITDIQMPLMNGITLLENVHHKFPHVKTIIVSGFSDFDYAQKALKFRVSDYLLKPVLAKDLSNSLIRVRTELTSENDAIKDSLSSYFLRVSPEEIAQTLQQYMVNNLSSDFNLKLIAEELSYSPGYLTKLFHQEFGINPSRYMMNLRISKAKHFLLHQPELTINQIGELVGYPEQSYFSRVFKKVTEQSPLEYRSSSGLK
ncbi:MAG TPA: response regulator [Epulopiscium sp.]|nr:response regulator [Candidatus Epulonipiscium sp.]